MRHQLSLWAAITLILFFLFYGLFQARNLIAGPQLFLSSPANGATLEGTTFMVEGTATHISHLALNGRQIFVDDVGVFEEELLVPHGYSILEVRASDRFGREVRQTVQLFGKPASPPHATTTITN